MTFPSIGKYGRDMNRTFDKVKFARYSCLLIAALLWGISFVVQAVDAISPFTFTAVRSLIGAIVLAPVIFIMRAVKKKKNKLPTFSPEERKKNLKTLLIGGACCGAVVAVATNLQQFGLSMNLEAGKAGFITAMYIVLVPIIGLFLGKKSGIVTWVSVAMGVVGLYFICVKDSFSINTGDICLILCAVAFSVHITVVDYFSAKTDGVTLSALQFFVSGLLSALLALIFERDTFSLSVILSYYPSFLYMGICSCGIAYTLQIIGQKNTNPTAASLIMSFEACFSVLGGFLLLSERLTVREWIGVAIMFLAILLTESNELFTKKAPTHET